MNNAELTVIIEEALRRESDLPVSRRTLARDLETTERRCREFRFELPTETPPSGEQTAKMAV